MQTEPELTKREYFAALAMQGILAGDLSIYKDEDGCIDIVEVGKSAVESADKTLQALND